MLYDPSSCRQGRRGAAFLSLLLLLLAMPATAQLLARADTVHVIAGMETILDIERLMANDHVSPEATWALVDTSTEFGSLSVQGSTLRFHPGNVPWGVATFEYELIHGKELSSTATVALHVIPRKIPLAGRWPVTPGPAPQACGQSVPGGDTPIFGDGVEVALFDPLTLSLRICDLTESHASQCFSRTTYSLPAANSGQTPDPWLPVVYDINRDAVWDEIVLVHPPSGRFIAFAFDESLQLVEMMQGESKVRRGVMPLAGNLSTDGQINNLAGYDLNAQQFTYYSSGPTSLGQGDGQAVSFGTPGGVALPVLGDWLEQGFETLGLWDLGFGELHYLVDHTGAGSSILSMAHAPGSSLEGWPLAIAKSRCGDGTYLALFDGLRGLELPQLPSRDCSFSPPCPPRHLTIDIDPWTIGN